MGKLNPDDILKALDCCAARKEGCTECPYAGEGCVDRLRRDAAALICKYSDAVKAMYHACIDAEEAAIGNHDLILNK